MYGKYETAKQVVSSYRRISHVLSEQLVSRDKVSADYLRKMRETLLRQHEELVKTQRLSGLPSRLPYCKKTIRNLLSTPKMLKKEPVDNCLLFMQVKHSYTSVSPNHAKQGSRCF